MNWTFYAMGWAGGVIAAAGIIIALYPKRIELVADGLDGLVRLLERAPYYPRRVRLEVIYWTGWRVGR